MPLIDESIRRQFRIRDAERRKDHDEADELRKSISPRQAALEKAQRALEAGLVDEAMGGSIGDGKVKAAELLKAGGGMMVNHDRGHWRRGANTNPSTAARSAATSAASPAPSAWIASARTQPS